MGPFSCQACLQCTGLDSSPLSSLLSSHARLFGRFDRHGYQAKFVYVCNSECDDTPFSSSGLQQHRVSSDPFWPVSSGRTLQTFTSGIKSI